MARRDTRINNQVALARAVPILLVTARRVRVARARLVPARTSVARALTAAQLTFGVLRASFARVNVVASHGHGTRSTVEAIVEAARVAHHFARRVAPPNGGHFGVAVGARQVRPFRDDLKTMGGKGGH